MIFTTKNRELAILGKTLSDVRQKLIDFNEIWMPGGRYGSNKAQIIPVANLTKVLSLDEAEQQLKSLNQFVVSGKMTYEQYFNTIGKGNTVLRNYVTTTERQSQSAQGLVKASEEARAAQIAHNEAIKNSTLSAKAGAAALKSLAIVGNMAFMFVATKLIGSFVNFIDNLHTTLKEQQEITQNLQGELSEIQSDISDVNSELQTTSDRIDELSKKDSLSFVEKEELENLTAQNEELERKNRLQSVYTQIHLYTNTEIEAYPSVYPYLCTCCTYQWNFAKPINKMLTKRKIYNPTQARSRCNSTATVHNMRKYRM